MSWGSLRFRLVAGGIVAILVALTIAGVGLTVLFERHIARTLADDLGVHLKQLIAGIDVDADGRLVVARPPADPRFADPLSGLYWQVGSEDGQLLRSRSLWDTTLFLPKDDLSIGEAHRHEARGPANARVLIAERGINLTIKGRPTPVHIAVAVDLARVSAAGLAFAKDLAAALSVLGLVLAIATYIQVALGLRPLAVLRRDISDIRSGRNHRLTPAAPVEVLPLVDEVNALLDSQEQEIERSRSRAADLAHGLKTPLAALASDAGRLRERGEHAIARDIEAVGEAMSRHVDREMTRARVRSNIRRGAGASTELAPLVRSVIATLARTPAGMRLTFEPRIPDGAAVPFDRTDLAEVLGNLLDNASRHALSRVRVTAYPGPAGASIAIEDDGKGITPAARSKVLERGARLDQRGEGAGLGFAIVLDVVDAYGWRLVLSTSDLGGLKAVIAPGTKIDHAELDASR
ncbi:MAG TPA: sensor histidine kinase [Methylocella sp.]|jgi:signal transduction histidine kinase